MPVPPTRLAPAQTQQIQRALSPFQPSFIYVFGSHGTPAQHPASDMDLAFLPRSPAPPLEVFSIANSLSELLNTEVDLVDLSNSSTVFRKEVVRTGNPIFIADLPALQQFEMYTLSDYARLNEERHHILASLRSGD